MAVAAVAKIAASATNVTRGIFPQSVKEMFCFVFKGELACEKATLIISRNSVHRWSLQFVGRFHQNMERDIGFRSPIIENVQKLAETSSRKYTHRVFGAGW